MPENPYNNIIDTTLDPTVKEEIKTKFDEIKELLPMLLDVPVEERKKGHKIGRHRRNFAHEANDAAHDHPTILPGAFNVGAHDNDRSLEGDLEDILTWANQCTEWINDTHLVVGREYYAGGRKVYEYVKSAEGLDELKAKLGEYFEQAAAEEAEEPTEPTP